MSKRIIKVFVKNYELGKVKTRLAKGVGDEVALKVYIQLVGLTKHIFNELNCIKEVWYSNFIDDKDSWAGSKVSKFVQEGNDLGAKMKNAFSKSFHENQLAKVILIGSDCADLNSSIIEEAFINLNTYDLVIGPAVDGGYYLIAMSTNNPFLFENINWSTEHVLTQTLNLARQNGLSVCLLKKLNDVDNKSDYELIKEKLASHD